MSYIHDNAVKGLYRMIKDLPYNQRVRSVKSNLQTDVKVVNMVTHKIVDTTPKETLYDTLINNLGRIKCFVHYNHVYLHTRNDDNKTLFVFFIHDKVNQDYFAVSIEYTYGTYNATNLPVKLKVEKNPTNLDILVTKKSGYSELKCIPKFDMIRHLTNAAYDLYTEDYIMSYVIKFLPEVINNIEQYKKW